MKTVEMPPILREGAPGYELEHYTVRLAARYLGITEEFVRDEIAAKRMGHRRNSARGGIRMSQADLDRWRQARRQEPQRSKKETRRVAEREALRKAAPARQGIELPAKRRFAVN